MQYYKKNILKETDDVDGVIEDTDESDFEAETNENIDDTDIEDMESALEEFQQEEDNTPLQMIENTGTDQEIEAEITSLPQLTEIDEDEIPAFVDFDNDEAPQEEVISDHHFHTITPLEAIADNKESSHNEETQDYPADNQEYKPWKILSYKVKDSNKQYAESNYSRLYQRKPKKEQK